MADKKTQDELIAWADSVSADPLQFVLDAFPWGEPLTDLADHDGPDTWQREVLEKVRDGLLSLEQAIQVAVASGHGPGKALVNTELLPTPNGHTPIAALRVGDYVFAADGKKTLVTGVFPQGRKPIYRVTFDDGSFSEASEDHLWAVKSRQERRTGKSWRIASTLEILKAGVKRSNGIAEARQWEIPTQGAARYPYRHLRFEPYLLALWLGNGSKKKNQITQPKHSEWEEMIARRNIRVVPYQDRNCDCWYVPHLRAALRDLGLFDKGSHERFIPAEYLIAHAEARKAVLAGLLDTDGTIGKDGFISFDTTSPQLAGDVIELVRSLGGKARQQATVKMPFYRGADGEKIYGRPCYRVAINVPFNPFRLTHKATRWKPSAEARYRTRFVDRIEYIGEHEATCIRVADPFHCFLTRDYIVTHNSALVSWLILWALGTKEDTKGIVTANTETQLRTKTWAELAKWHRLCILGHWFIFTATALYAADKKHEKTWRIDAISWSENRTEAFAGMHNEGKRILVVYDEASAIPDIIWEVTEGALTDKNTEIIWAVFGNPTRNHGRFKECFGRFRHRWLHYQVDSRSAKLTNKKQIAQWVADYGEDSDFVRVRVRGHFPRAGSMQFISIELAESAMGKDREHLATIYDPFLLGVDVGRFGDDPSVIYFRRGRDGRTIPPIQLRGLDTMQVAARVADEFTFYKADGVFVDGGGVGAGVVDRLRYLKIPVIEVQFGAASDRTSFGEDDQANYANKRAEMWGNMKKWLRGGSVVNDPELLSDLTGVEYGYTLREGRDAIILEKKEDMKKRGLASPNIADALALTFAYPIAPSDHRTVSYGNTSRFEAEYSPLAAGYASIKGQQRR